MKYFDFHTHFDFYKDEELDEMVQNIVGNRIRTFSASVNIESFERNLLIKKLVTEKCIDKGFSSEEAERLFTATFGVHPSYCKNLPDSENEAYSLLDPYYCKSEVISECGLDYFWEKECSKEKQRLHLEIALDNAHRFHKVIVLHTKGAEKEIYEILKNFSGAKPVIHWYDGPFEVYRKFLEKGYYQTFGCELKYKKTIQDFLLMTPDELILPETDNPTGEPWLGGTDFSPLLIKRVYKDISEIKKMNLEEVSFLLEKNLTSLLKN